MYTFNISDHGKNLAPEGKAYLFNGRRKNNAFKTIDGKTTDVFQRDACMQSYYTTMAWWKVVWDKLIEVYAVEIMPGKLDIYIYIHIYIYIYNLFTFTSETF